MNKVFPAVLIILPMLMIAIVAGAVSVTVDPTVVDRSYQFQVEPPRLIVIGFNSLQPNTGVDNLALSFRENGTTNEVFIIFVKTNGDLVLHVPAAGVTTDQVIGSWKTMPSITVRYWSDKLQILDPSGNVLYEVNGNFPMLGDVWAHSSNTTTPAFTAGTITIEAQDDPSVISRDISNMLVSLMPLIATLIGFAFAIAMMDKILNTLTKLFR
ncbi:MAG: hypothetical protein F7C36_00360 [Desulfurococcales archaeon]|nr:hypothetical protein [Desulfurococcales archaeon]